jgi:soluble cytochrome b562
VPTSDYTPTVAQVGALLRARTKDASGNELGTFNEETRPTGEQVAGLIATSVSRMRARFGEELAEDLREDAASLVTLRTAMLVELSFFPEQIQSDRSPYDRYKDLYDEGLKAFIVEVDRLGVDAEAGSLDDRVAGLPVSAFPANDGGLIGWQTVM